MNRIFLFFALMIPITIVISCKTSKSLLIKEINHVSYKGRINHNSDGSKTFIWSGSSATAIFEGTNIEIVLKDETGNNYYNVILDNEVIDIIRPDTVRTSYPITIKTKGKHNLQLFKRTEYDRGNTIFYGFSVNGGTKILPKELPSEKQIVFYGNSISAGYSVSDYSGADSPDSIYTNNYQAYSALTARYFDADYSCICKSGIGIMVSWFPTIMPDIYDHLDPKKENSLWDYSNDDTDIVVINLFQNDSWLVLKPEMEVFNNKFGETPPSKSEIIAAYQSFVNNIRSKHPHANIICALGSMDATQDGSPWPAYIESAVTNINDDRIYTFFFPYKNTPGHPKIDEQAQMSKDLIDYIVKQDLWN
ncbi:MAG: hypothetical protein V3V14_01480 [Saprospiraceae bacterium]